MAIQTHNMYHENLVLPISSQNNFNIENYNNNNNNMFNSYGLNDEFGYNDYLQQKILQQQQFQQQQYMAHLQNHMKVRKNRMNEGNLVISQLSKRQKLAINPSTTGSTITSESDDYLSMNFSKGFSAQFEKQSNEIDRYIQLQNEWLKLALHEQRKQQFGAIIKKLESRALYLLKQKDDQISQATKKSMELQEIINKLEFENQAWQKVALDNQSIVFSLNNTLQQLQQQQQQQDCSSSSSNVVDDAQSCHNGVEEIRENKGKFDADGFQTRAVCKVCKSRNACILMLPCRHLCSCKVCDAVLDACPVCKSPKKGSIDAIIL